MEFWNAIHRELVQGHHVVMMYVVQSEGSSPGRTGFRMFVSASGMMFGSIGGGIMEHKLVELCKQDLLLRTTKSTSAPIAFQPFIKRQIHQSGVTKDMSGMICSGEQTVAFYPLTTDNLSFVNEVKKAVSRQTYGVLIGNEKGLRFIPGESLDQKIHSQITDPESWEMKEDIGFMPELHILGGGHVALALSKMAAQLDFRITTYDDRENLNTVQRNAHARHVTIEDYARTGEYIPEGDNKYVVLMSFGYRTDKVILKQLIGHEFSYLGMMGSKEKVKQLFAELKEEGIPAEQIEKVYSPIGVQIKSETPEEIAVSILAEIIRVKNV